MVSKLTQDDFAGAQYIIGTVGKDKAHFMGLADPFRTSWLLRGGMENLLMDFLENPGFVRDLLRAIADHNIAQV